MRTKFLLQVRTSPNNPKLKAGAWKNFGILIGSLRRCLDQAPRLVDSCFQKTELYNYEFRLRTVVKMKRLPRSITILWDESQDQTE